MMLHESQLSGEAGTEEEGVGSVEQSIEERSINAIRILSIDAVEQAQSGHPGLPMGAAPMAYVLWQRHLRFNPSNPKWPDRDRFVLSAGHGSMLLYSLLHLTGFDLSLDDIKNFRQWGSKTPGHPEVHTRGVEATTGPLGQGAANAVGMAIAERALAHRFNGPGHTIVDHFTFALCSDGDLMEGIVAEAASIAGHLRLGKLIYLYDSNDVSLDGPTSITFTEDVGRRFEAYGWQVLHVDDGNEDIDGIDAAIRDAKADTSRPSLIIVRTTIGYGAKTKAGTYKAHGAPLGTDEVNSAKSFFNWDGKKPFEIPADICAHLSASARGRSAEAAWNERLVAWEQAHPELAREWHATMRGELPDGWADAMPSFETGSQIETRVASGKVLNAIAKRVAALIGGDADLSSSTRTAVDGADDFDGQTGAGRNIRYGVREHAMAGITNGMAYHGGLRPYASTFFIFSDYMRPSVRLAAMNDLPTIYLWTHDSIAVGEDGPTHEPIEQLASLRAMPNMTVIRPADANETVAAWRVTMPWRSGPIGIVLSRQKLEVLAGTAERAATGVARGAYVLADADDRLQLILIASGSEVQVAVAARTLVEAGGIGTRVVSMPSWELFAAQDAAYRESVLPTAVTLRVSIEAGSTFGWERWVGSAGIAFGIDRFGASAPAEENLKQFGFTAENIARIAKDLVEGNVAHAARK